MQSRTKGRRRDDRRRYPWFLRTVQVVQVSLFIPIDLALAEAIEQGRASVWAIGLLALQVRLLVGLERRIRSHTD